MNKEIEPAPKQYENRFRHTIPERHRHSLDTRIAWLWNQRFGTVQMVWQQSKDMLDVTAATLILQAIFGKDLVSIEQVLHRIEGGAVTDEDIVSESVTRV